MTEYIPWGSPPRQFWAWHNHAWPCPVMPTHWLPSCCFAGLSLLLADPVSESSSPRLAQSSCLSCYLTYCHLFRMLLEGRVWNIYLLPNKVSYTQRRFSVDAPSWLTVLFFDKLGKKSNVVSPQVFGFCSWWPQGSHGWTARGLGRGASTPLGIARNLKTRELWQKLSSNWVGMRNTRGHLSKGYLLVKKGVLTPSFTSILL